MLSLYSLSEGMQVKDWLESYGVSRMRFCLYGLEGVLTLHPYVALIKSKPSTSEAYE